MIDQRPRDQLAWDRDRNFTRPRSRTRPRPRPKIWSRGDI